MERPRRNLRQPPQPSLSQRPFRQRSIPRFAKPWLPCTRPVKTLSTQPMISVDTGWTQSGLSTKRFASSKSA